MRPGRVGWRIRGTQYTLGLKPEYSRPHKQATQLLPVNKPEKIRCFGWKGEKEGRKNKDRTPKPKADARCFSGLS